MCRAPSLPRRAPRHEAARPAAQGRARPPGAPRRRRARAPRPPPRPRSTASPGPRVGGAGGERAEGCRVRREAPRLRSAGQRRSRAASRDRREEVLRVRRRGETALDPHGDEQRTGQRRRLGVLGVRRRPVPAGAGRRATAIASPSGTATGSPATRPPASSRSSRTRNAARDGLEVERRDARRGGAPPGLPRRPAHDRLARSRRERAAEGPGPTARRRRPRRGSAPAAASPGRTSEPRRGCGPARRPPPAARPGCRARGGSGARSTAPVTRPWSRALRGVSPGAKVPGTWAAATTSPTCTPMSVGGGVDAECCSSASLGAARRGCLPRRVVPVPIAGPHVGCRRAWAGRSPRTQVPAAITGRADARPTRSGRVTRVTPDGRTGAVRPARSGLPG